MFISNVKFYIRQAISITDGLNDTFLISNDFEGNEINTNGEQTSIVIKSGNQIERMIVIISGGIATIIKRGLTQDEEPTEDSNLKKPWNEGAIGYITALAFNLIDKTTGQGVVFQNATARDAAITNPQAGMQGVYLTDEGYFSDYVGGSWIDRANGATPNASETIAGKVEIATDLQITSGIDTGETGALLVAKPSQLKKSISLKTAGTTFSDTDEIVVNISGEDKRITGANLRESIAASETLKGTVEKSTNAEAIAKTDIDRFITPSQLAFIAPNLLKTQTYAFSSLPTSFNIAHGLSFAPSYVKVTTYFDKMGTSQVSGSICVGTYKSGSYSTRYATFASANPPTFSGYSTTTSTISQLDWQNSGTADDINFTMTISGIDTTNISFAISRTLGAGATGNIWFDIEYFI